MKNFAIMGALRPPRTDVVAMVCGCLCSVAAALPAQSADLYPYPYYQDSGYGPGYSGYYQGCHSCGCRPCCNPCCNPCGHRPIIQPSPVVERHWDYWERHYVAYPPHSPYPGGYAGYPSYPAGYPYYPYADDRSAYTGGPRPHLGFGGVQYPPAPISYERPVPPAPYQYQPAAPYEYRTVTPAQYDYEPSPRPPVGIPGAYSSASYVQ